LYALPFKLRLSRLRQLISLFLTIEEHHKHDIPQPHWYLFMLGVSPAYQRQGIGSYYWQPIIKQADKKGLPCCLETSTEEEAFASISLVGLVANGWITKGSKFWTMITA